MPKEKWWSMTTTLSIQDRIFIYRNSAIFKPETELSREDFLIDLTGEIPADSVGNLADMEDFLKDL